MDNPELDHVLKFLFGDLETVRCETSGTDGDWWSSFLDVVTHRRVRCGDIGESGKL